MATSSPSPGRFQFTLARILWTMFVCAVLAAIVRALGLPAVLQIPLLILLVLYAAYAIFRLPHVLGDLRGRSAKWQRIQEKRAELQRLADKQRKPADRPDPSASIAAPNDET